MKTQPKLAVRDTYTNDPLISFSQGKTTLAAHTLYDIVRKLPAGAEIKLELIGLNVQVSAGKSKCILPSLYVAYFLVMTEVEKGNEVSIAA